MAIDHYSLCPCGNGKKLKFCKCVDNVQDLEKLIKLIEGGQGVAALDRINQLLDKTPNAAWLLAIKGEVALQLREFDTFRDNASRFLKLKPDNPLALAMRALSGVLGEESPQETVRNFYDSIAESREALPGMLPTVANGLVSQLVRSGNASIISKLLNIISTFEGTSQIENSLRGDPALHTLSKIEPPTEVGPPDRGWKERLAEVKALAKSFRFSQAESKLRSILRDFPDAPEPLSWLARTQIALLDQYAAFDSCKKLSETEGLTETNRFLWGAWTIHLDSKNVLASIPAYSVYREIESADEALTTLQSLDNVLVITGDSEETNALLGHKATLVGDEVPAKATGLIYDRSIKLGDGEEKASASVLGQVTLYGKQTDRPARALVQCCDLEVARTSVDGIIEKLDLKDEVDFDLNVSITYAEWAGRDRFEILPNGGRRPLSPAESQEEILNDFLACPLTVMDGKSLNEVKDSADHRNLVGSIAVHASLWGRLSFTPESVRKLFAELNIELPTAKPGNDAPNCLEVVAVDAASLSDEDLTNTTYAALDMGLSAVIHECSKQIMARKSMSERYDLRFVAAQASLRFATNFDDAVKLLDVTIESLDKLGGEVGQAILQKLTLLAENGRDEDARLLMKESMEKYPSDPHLMAFIQQVMAGAPPMGPGSMTGGGPGAAPAAAPQQSGGSNLVIPGSEPEPPQGESKIWLPGS